MWHHVKFRVMKESVNSRSDNDYVIIPSENKNFFQNPYFVVARQISLLYAHDELCLLSKLLKQSIFVRFFRCIIRSLVHNFHSVPLLYV